MKIVTIVPRGKYDYLAHSVIEGLRKHKVNIIASDFGNTIEKSELYSEHDIIKHSHDADFIFAIWGKSPGRYHLLDKINKPEKTIYIDGSEWSFNGKSTKEQVLDSKIDPLKRRGNPWINDYMIGRVSHYFKRECYPQDIEEFGCIPLPFAALDSYFKHYTVKKEIDLYCSFGQVNTGLRQEIESECHKLGKNGLKVAITRDVPSSTYYELISKSYLAVDAFGGGECNARMFQILANQSCLFTEKPNILYPNPYVDGNTVIHYKDIHEFRHKLTYYLDNRATIRLITENAFEHTKKYHTSYARVKYIFDKIMR